MTAGPALSYLYVPGDAGRRLELACTRGSDAVIADLEDSVAATQKAEARRQVSTWLTARSADRVERWVRN